MRLVDDIIPSVRTKPQKHKSTTLIRNTCSRPAQRCNPMSLESWDLAGRPSRSREDCGKRSTKGDGHRKSTSTMSPFTSTSMMSRRVSCACGRSSRGAIARRWLGRKSRPVKIPNRVSIRERPDDVNSRRDFGHWEGDTVVGDQHQTGVHTEVERVSRLLFAHPVPHIRAKETCLAQLWIFASLPQQARQSTTLDNGSENSLHTQLQKELGIRTYFAHPYCSWQRGTNEYTNGLLRRYFPKRTDFRNVTQEQLNDVVHRLNNTPRKVLQYHTPREVFSERLNTSNNGRFFGLHLGSGVLAAGDADWA